MPPNVRAGQQFRVMINNQEVMVTCPRGVRSGQRVTFQLPNQERPPQPAPNHQMFEVAGNDNKLKNNTKPQFCVFDKFHFMYVTVQSLKESDRELRLL